MLRWLAAWKPRLVKFGRRPPKSASCGSQAGVKLTAQLGCDPRPGVRPDPRATNGCGSELLVARKISWR